MIKKIIVASALTTLALSLSKAFAQELPIGDPTKKTLWKLVLTT